MWLKRSRKTGIAHPYPNQGILVFPCWKQVNYYVVYVPETLRLTTTMRLLNTRREDTLDKLKFAFQHMAVEKDNNAKEDVHGEIQDILIYENGSQRQPLIEPRPGGDRYSRFV